VKILINLGDETSWLRKSRTFGIVIRIILEALVKVNQGFLRTHNVPPLYKSGVRYGEEPAGALIFKTAGSGAVESNFAKNINGQVEEFADIATIISRGWGDCDDLAPWRCAELREAGEKAKIRIQWKTTKAGKLFHIVVRRGDGSVEDPSAVLGMGGINNWKHPRRYQAKFGTGTESFGKD